MSELPDPQREIPLAGELAGTAEEGEVFTGFAGAEIGETFITVPGERQELPDTMGVAYAAGGAALSAETSNFAEADPGSDSGEPVAPVGRFEVHDRPEDPGLPHAGGDRPGEPPTDKPPEGIGETGGEDGEPLLRTTKQDLLWESWFGGEVIIATDPRRPNTEVVKVYRQSGVIKEHAHLLLPSNAHVRVASGDIVQAYGRGEDGRIKDKPDAIFQVEQGGPPWMMLPKGYYAEFDEEYDPDVEALRAAFQSIAADDTQPKVVPISGRTTPSHLGLDILSAVTLPLHPREQFQPRFAGESRDITYVHYPLMGRNIHVVMPGGHLVDGQTHDIIEKLRADPLGISYEPLWRQRLGDLVRQKGYLKL